MDKPSVKEHRARLQQAIAQLLKQLDPIQEELSAITIKAQAEGWDVAKYQEARASATARKAAIAAEIKRRQAELSAGNEPVDAPAPVPDPATVPTFVRFSTVQGPVWEILARVDAGLTRWNCVLRRCVRLQRSASPEEDGGLRFAGDMQPSSSLEHARTQLGSSTAFALVYLARDPQSLFTLFVFDASAVSFCVSLDIGTPMVVFQNDRFELGAWLEAFILEVVSGLNAGVGSYGTTAPLSLLHQPIDLDAFLESLRGGAPLAARGPTLHVVATALISKAELDAATRKSPEGNNCDYRLAPHYHLLGRIRLEE